MKKNLLKLTITLCVVILQGVVTQLAAQSRSDKFVIKTGKVYATADAYTNCIKTDNTNFGSDKYLKVARNNHRINHKFNSYIRFDLDSLFKDGQSELISVELYLYNGTEGLLTERRVIVGLVDDDKWDENKISGSFRADNQEYTKTKQIAYFTKKKGEVSRWYSVRSTVDFNSALYKALLGKFDIDDFSLTFRLYPHETAPDEDDDTSINFHSRENKTNQPYLLITRKVFKEK